MNEATSRPQRRRIVLHILAMAVSIGVAIPGLAANAPDKQGPAMGQRGEAGDSQCHLDAIKVDGVYARIPGLYSQVIHAKTAQRYEIAGSVGYDETGNLPDSIADQSKNAMHNIDLSLKAAGLGPANVSRMRVYTTDIDSFIKQGINIVFGYFPEPRPTATLIQVSRLSNPKMLVEVDLTAVPCD